MIDELFINGTQIDITNVEIPRKYVSPYFQKVDAWRNNGTYTVTLPWTTNNTEFFEHCFSEDMLSQKPYSIMYADYYSEGEPIFRNAETKILGVTDEGLEVQFVWGLNREKYLSLFNTKLNEIRPNGSTITEADWIVNWRLENTIYATGKKFTYLDYVSGERESDVFLTSAGTVLKPAVVAPEPYLSSQKAMTQHPFVSFNNILDLIIANSATEETLTADAQTLQDTAVFDEDIVGIEIGNIVKTIDSIDVTGFNIRVAEIINAKTIRFNQDITDFFTTAESWVFAPTTIASTEFDAIKARLTGKGLILGGNKGDKTFTKTKTFGSDVVLGNSGVINLDAYIGSFYIESITDNFGIGEYVLGNDKSVLNIILNLEVTNDSLDEMQISLYKNIDGVETKVYDFPYTVDDYQTVYDCNYEFQPEYGVSYLLRYANTGGGTLNAGAVVEISQNIQTALYSMVPEVDEDDPAGYYDCLMNLPEMTAAEFIQQMLILTGLFFFADEDGNLEIVSLDDFADNLNNGDIVDWSKYNVQVLDGSFQFNENAQSNIIKYKNSDDTLYESEQSLNTFDATLEKEKDLYVVQFNLPVRSTTNTVEFILYKQRVESSDIDGAEQISFKNEYDGKESVVVYDNSGVATINQSILPNDRLSQGVVQNGFVAEYYDVYKEIIRQPIIREVEVNLDFYTAARIDFKKPVFVEWFGRNCMVLELTALKDEPCVAKLLIIRRAL